VRRRGKNRTKHRRGEEKTIETEIETKRGETNRTGGVDGRTKK